MDLDTDFEMPEPEDILPSAELTAKPTDTINKSYQGLLFLWIMFCVFSFSWFVKKLFRGRNKMRTDFITIEEQLKRLQMSLENKEKAAHPDKFDEAINSLTNMTALDPVPEQEGGQIDGKADTTNGNVEKEEKGEDEFKIIEENVQVDNENDLEDKKNL